MRDARSIAITALMVVMLAATAVVGILFCQGGRDQAPRTVMPVSIDSNQAARAEARGDVE